MDANGAIVLTYLAIKYLEKKKKRQRRKWWVHPINSERYLHGQFQILYTALRADNEKNFNYFRMSVSSFDELLSLIKYSIKHEDTIMRCAISPEEMLAMTLRLVKSFCFSK
jgi:hypothetical protein